MSIADSLLWLAVCWPLLLALPALHKRLPLPQLLAMLPAVLLILFVVDNTLTVPWLLFGTSFSLDEQTRWLLAVIVALWLLVAMMLWRTKHPAPNNYLATLFLLTMSGNIGLILASDLVTFFCFSTLMSYGFYGLLIHGSNDAVRRAGRLYLICLIVADLALFEALLLVASNTEHLQFQLVQQVMSNVPTTDFYMAMVLGAFALKAGIWPFSLWLSTTFSATSSPKRLLLVSVPVAMALLGMLRWLPLGQYNFDAWGLILQSIGGVGILYVMFKFYAVRQIRLFPAYAAIAYSSLFIALLGIGLTYPSLWHDFHYLAYPYIAVLVISMVCLILLLGRVEHEHQPPETTLHGIKQLNIYLKQKFEDFIQWRNVQLHKLNALRHAAHQIVLQSLHVMHMQKLQRLMDRWSVRMMMAVMMGMLLIWLMI